MSKAVLLALALCAELMGLNGDVFGRRAAHRRQVFAHRPRRAVAVAAQDRFDHGVVFAPRGGETAAQIELGASERRQARAGRVEKLAQIAVVAAGVEARMEILIEAL